MIFMGVRYRNLHNAEVPARFLVAHFVFMAAHSVLSPKRVGNSDQALISVREKLFWNPQNLQRSIVRLEEQKPAWSVRLGRFRLPL